VVERVCFARTGSVGSIHPVAPLTFVSQAGSLVTIRVLVADATFKRPKDFFSTPQADGEYHYGSHRCPSEGLVVVSDVCYLRVESHLE
jgi:hypothetical protein